MFGDLLPKLLSALIVVIIFFFSIYMVAILNHSFDLVVGVLGTLLGGLSLVFGSYFAVLAVNAFGHLYTIQKAEETAKEVLEELKSRTLAVEKTLEEVNETRSEIDRVRSHVFKSLLTILQVPSSGDQEAADSRRRKLIEKLSLDRAKFLANLPGQTEDQITTHLLTIAEIGTKEDADWMESLATSDGFSMPFRQNVLSLVRSCRERNREPKLV